MIKDKTVKSRVLKHRKIKKSKGFKTVSFQLPPLDFIELKKFKKANNLTYADAIHELLICLKSPRKNKNRRGGGF